MLGEEQHGHMEAVGYDLYCKMLNEAVLELKGEGKSRITKLLLILTWMRISLPHI